MSRRALQGGCKARSDCSAGGGESTSRERALMTAAAAMGEEGMRVCEEGGIDVEEHGERTVMVVRVEGGRERVREDRMRSMMSQCGWGKHDAVMMAMASLREGREKAGRLAIGGVECEIRNLDMRSAQMSVHLQHRDTPGGLSATAPTWAIVKENKGDERR
jgi:hypothetical protein